MDGCLAVVLHCLQDNPLPSVFSSLNLKEGEGAWRGQPLPEQSFLSLQQKHPTLCRPEK